MMFEKFAKTASICVLYFVVFSSNGSLLVILKSFNVFDRTFGVWCILKLKSPINILRSIDESMDETASVSCCWNTVLGVFGDLYPVITASSLNLNTMMSE